MADGTRSVPATFFGGIICMNGVWSLNLIHFLDFYFAFMFFAGTLRRLGQYQSVAHLVFSGPTRWALAQAPERISHDPLDMVDDPAGPFGARPMAFAGAGI